MVNPKVSLQTATVTLLLLGSNLCYSQIDLLRALAIPPTSSVPSDPSLIVKARDAGTLHPDLRTDSVDRVDHREKRGTHDWFAESCQMIVQSCTYNPKAFPLDMEIQSPLH
jgi:hypothetical protein